MKPFLDNRFLLENEIAVQLYEQYAAPMPVIDYHNHLSPKDIAENRKFSNITEAWLDGDHYKWRAMRMNGISEECCTGQALPFEKFSAWAKTVPYTLRNPLYHWTHLELRNYFGITHRLDERTACEVYDTCSAMLQQDDFSVRSLLSRMKVKIICTTDDPVDQLVYHSQFAKENKDFKMFPTFRPDNAYNFEDVKSYQQYLETLSGISKVQVKSLDDLIDALKNRMLFFNELGCRSADHGLDQLYFDGNTFRGADALFKKIAEGKSLDHDEKVRLRNTILIRLSKHYHELKWVQQFHLGALRNNNTRMAQSSGRDTGFDSIGNFIDPAGMSKFFDHLDSTNQLAKTIIYNSNPSDNAVFATMAGNFCDGSVPGKIQWGSGWWFLDQQDGMKKQMNTLSNMGLLSRFVGMVTDSRSFMSFPRHEYFRRILCNLLGEDVVKGELPHDVPLLGRMVSDICYHNARDYFNFKA